MFRQDLTPLCKKYQIILSTPEKSTLIRFVRHVVMCFSSTRGSSFSHCEFSAAQFILSLLFPRTCHALFKFNLLDGQIFPLRSAPQSTCIDCNRGPPLMQLSLSSAPIFSVLCVKSEKRTTQKLDFLLGAFVSWCGGARAKGGVGRLRKVGVLTARQVYYVVLVWCSGGQGGGSGLVCGAVGGPLAAWRRKEGASHITHFTCVARALSLL